MSDKELIIKPTFRFLPNMVRIELFFINIFFFFIINSISNIIFNIKLTVFVELFILLIIIFLHSFYMKYVYEHTSYTFSESKIVSNCDYLVFKEVRTIKTSEIREVSELQGLVQKKFSLGSVILHSRITNGGDIVINNIQDHIELATKIRATCKV